MKAVVYSDYGGPEVLRLADVEPPTPNANEVLVKVHAAALNPVDWHFVRGAPFPVRMATGGFFRPRPGRRIGADFSGTIEAVGSGVTGYSIGEAVFGMGEGSLAEYLVVPADRSICAKPAALTHEQAAGVALAGLTALQALRDKAMVRAGHHVLIVGAAGGIGTFAVQLAKAWGAEVTGVQSTGAAELVRSLGASHGIDYTKEDFTAGKARYDVIFDNVCARPLSDVLRVLKPAGIYLPNSGGTPEKGISVGGIVSMLARRPFIKQKVAMVVCRPNRRDLQLLADMLQAGAVRPVVDRSYPLAAAADAFRYLEAGHAHGKVVVTVHGA